MLLRNGTCCCAPIGAAAASASATARILVRMVLLLCGAFDGRIARRTDARRADEQTRTVFDERDLSACRPIGAVARLEAANSDLGARRQRVAVEAATQQRVRSRAFECPVLNLAAIGLHGEVNPRMRIAE